MAKVVENATDAEKKKLTDKGVSLPAGAEVQA